MEKLEGFYDARDVESRRGIVELTAIAQDRPQFAAKTHFHEHVQVLGVAKRAIESRVNEEEVIN